jgi:hypothetical protein
MKLLGFGATITVYCLSCFRSFVVWHDSDEQMCLICRREWERIHECR